MCFWIWKKSNKQSLKMIQVHKKNGNVKCNKTITALHFVQYYSVIKWVFSYKACIMSEAVVLDRGQLYRPEATPRAYTADGGPIWLYEDIIQALYENTHFMTPLLTNDLKLQYFSYFFVVVITIQLIKTWYDCMMT
jgi:hypothetical protein